MNQIRGWLALNGLRLWFPAGVRVALIALAGWGFPEIPWVRLVLVIEATLAFVRYLLYWRKRERTFADFARFSGTLQMLVGAEKKGFRRQMVAALTAQGFVLRPAKGLKADFAGVGEPNAGALMFSGTDAAGQLILARCIQNTPRWNVTAREIKRFLAVVADQRAHYGVIATTSRFTPGAKAISDAYPINFVGGLDLVRLFDQLSLQNTAGGTPDRHSGPPI
jgi:hypothetical protein